MAGTRKYTQDEINNMTTAQRSAAWAGADQASRDALHAANEKALSSTHSYNERTGSWTPQNNSITDLVSRTSSVKTPRTEASGGSYYDTHPSQQWQALNTNTTASGHDKRQVFDPASEAMKDAMRDYPDRNARANTVQLSSGYAIYFDDTGAISKAVHVTDRSKYDLPGVQQALRDLNNKGVYTGQQQLLSDYANGVANGIAQGRDANWVNDRATFLGNTAKQGGYTGNWAAQLLDQIQNGTLTPTAGTAGAALPKSGGNGGSDYYGEFLRGVQNGADYNTLLNLYNQRVAKTAPGGGFEQYADDDAMRYMRSYLENMGGGQPYSPGALPQGGTLGQIQDAIAELQNKDYSYGGGRWDSILDQLAREAINFNYDDWTKSDQYRALEDRFGRQGDMTMRDVLGQVSSRTGGLASSYATTAAQQQYNDYMAQLESVARDQWADEKKTLLDNAQMAQGMSEQEYSRWLDAQKLGDNADSAALSALYDLLGYEADRDDEMYKRSQNAQEMARSDIYDFLVNGGGSVGDLDADLIRKSGYTTAQLDNMVSQYQAAQAAAAAKAAKGRSSGGGGSRSSRGASGEADYDGLFLAAQESGNPKSWLAQKGNYQKYGFTSSSGLYDDYQNWESNNPDLANWDRIASSIGAQLQNGKEDQIGGVIAALDNYWPKLSPKQKKSMQALLDRYGYEYNP